MSLSRQGPNGYSASSALLGAMQNADPATSHTFGSQPVKSRARSVGSDLTQTMPIPRPLRLGDLSVPADKNGFAANLTLHGELCPPLDVLGLSVTDGMMSGRHFCRAVRPTERDREKQSNRTIESSSRVGICRVISYIPGLFPHLARLNWRHFDTLLSDLDVGRVHLQRVRAVRESRLE